MAGGSFWARSFSGSVDSVGLDYMSLPPFFMNLPRHIAHIFGLLLLLLCQFMGFSVDVDFPTSLPSPPGCWSRRLQIQTVVVRFVIFMIRGFPGLRYKQFTSRTRADRVWRRDAAWLFPIVYHVFASVDSLLCVTLGHERRIFNRFRMLNVQDGRKPGVETIDTR